ncbi:MAG: hypothetical protein KDC67_09740 [Ignavibacteriae bacterium]|nr:hypothetical protein [Ignavibacteriota bacterium]
MKKTVFLILFFIISLNLIGQELPNLNLREQITNETELPENIETNEIGVIIKLTGGWSAYDYTSFFIYKNDGDIIAYSKKSPKSYLKNKKELKEEQLKIELSAERIKELFESLNSNITINFLKYSQKDFKKSVSNGPPPCGISDATGFQFTFIQNGKQNSYKYYAPEFHLKKCNNKTINKVMLGEFVELIKIWKLRK